MNTFEIFDAINSGELFVDDDFTAGGEWHGLVIVSGTPVYLVESSDGQKYADPADSARVEFYTNLVNTIGVDVSELRFIPKHLDDVLRPYTSPGSDGLGINEAVFRRRVTGDLPYACRREAGREEREGSPETAAKLRAVAYLAEAILAAEVKNLLVN